MATHAIFGGRLDMTLSERRRWAERRGNPSWLWPEVAIGAWQSQLGEIAAVLTSHLAGCDLPAIAGDGLALSLAAYTSGTGPLLGWWVEEGRLPADAASRQILQGHLAANRVRMTKLERGAARAFGKLRRAGIPAIVLKGMDTAYSVFSHPAMRPMADIDVLVPARLQSAAIGVLGWRADCAGWGETTLRPCAQAQEPLSLFRLEADDPWSLDLHHRLDFLVAPPDRIARLDRAEPFAHTRAHPVFEGALVLSDALRLLHLTVHAGGGLHSMTLLRQFEIASIIRNGGGFQARDWEDFIELAERCDALRFTYPALAMAEKLAAGTVPGPVLQQSREICPANAVALIDKLSPARAHRVARQSVREHFMWSAGLGGIFRRAMADVRPAATLRATAAVFRRRLWQAARGIPSG